MTSNVPKIRFDGYDGEWEEYKLSSVTQKIGSGKTPSGGKASYDNEGIPLIRSQNIYENQVNLNDVVYINTSIDEEMSNSRVKKNDVLLNITGASIGRSAVYGHDFSANVNQHVCIIRLLDFINSQFVQLNLSSDKGQKEIEKNQAGGGREGLNFKQIANFQFAYPLIKEQQAIGSFFKELDDRITLQQTSLERLKETKQGFLQKMFPKKGETVPEIRFDGFDGQWENKALGDYLSYPEKIKVKVSDNNDIMTLKLNLKGLTKGSNRETLSLGSTIYYERKAGQFIYGKQNFFNGSMAIIPEEFDGKATSGDVPSLEIDNIDPDFLFRFISRKQYWKEKESKASGTGSKRIHESLLFTFEISVPVSFEEQRTIGSFFKELDDRIAIEERELELLKETKKAFLQKMFV